MNAERELSIARELLAVVHAWCYTSYGAVLPEMRTHPPLYPGNHPETGNCSCEQPLADAIKDFLERTA